MRSDALKKGLSRAPARAMLRATGLDDAELEKPLVAVIATWTEVMPCNVHLRALAEEVKAGVRAAGGTPIEFNTIAVSDGITMGTDGMRGSLVSREVIADSIELFALGHLLDGVVALVGLRQDHPRHGDGAGAARRAGRSCSTAARSTPGRFEGRDVTIQDVFEAVGALAAGKMSESELDGARGRAPVPAPARAAGSSPPTRWRWR